MKKILLLMGFILLPLIIQAQNVFSGEPVQWVGRPNGYSTTPYNSDYRTTAYRSVSTATGNPSDGRGQWATTINVQSAGGDITPDNMPGGGGAGWLLISGPSNNRFGNKWNFDNVAQASLNAVNDITRQGGGQDMGLNMSTAGHYTFVMRDAGYNNSQVYIGYTNAAPVTVTNAGTSFPINMPVIAITTSGTPSAGENIYVRYRATTNDFTASTLMAQATGSGTAWSATLPIQDCNQTVFYYVFSSTRTLAQLNGDSEQNRSLATLRYDDNSGGNHSFIQSNNYWTGTSSNLWNVATNWSCGSVPDGTRDITIASGTPELNVDFTLATGRTLTLSGTGTLIVNPTASLTIAGTANFGGNAVTLQSTAAGTARIGQVTGTLNGATNVIVERHIPAKRAWRLLTAPLRGSANNSIFANWQNNGAAGDGLTGLLLWHPDGTITPLSSNTGFFLGTQANVRSYTNGVWSNVANSNTASLFTATENNPYLVFVAGPHASANVINTSEATTARATGTLVTGTVTESLNANQFKLIGNPYASPIDPAILVNGSSNTGATLWLMNPTVGFGAYVTYGNGNWSIPTVGNDSFIQSGQGFFARTISASTFTINETHKVAGNSNNWFERNANNNAVTESVDKIRVLLYKQEATNWKIADGVLAVNQATGNNEVDEKDAGKISNFNESLMFKNNTSSISIEYRALPQTGEIQPLRMIGTTAVPYQLRVYTEEYTNSTLQPYLEDTTTGTLTAIPMDGSEVIVPFTGIVSNGTTPDLRFRIVYQMPLSTTATTLANVSVFPNPIVNSQVNINLGSDPTDAHYTITNLLGQSIQKGALLNTQNTITIRSVPQGIYILNISQADQSYTTKIYVQ
jgi:hypothetical protein